MCIRDSADVVGHVRQELRHDDAGFLGHAQGFIGLGAEPLGADGKCDADRGNQNAQATNLSWLTLQRFL